MIVLSSVALVISAGSGYFNIVRQTDYLSGIVTIIPIALARGTEIIFYDEISINLINSGNRTAVIDHIDLIVDQSLAKQGAENNCMNGTKFRTDFETLVIKEKEIVAKKVKIIPLGRSDEEKLKSGHNITLALSDENKKRDSFLIEMCLGIGVSTPALANRYKIIPFLQFETVKDRYEFSFSSDRERLSKPFEILRQSGSIFSD